MRDDPRFLVGRLLPGWPRAGPRRAGQRAALRRRGAWHGELPCEDSHEQRRRTTVRFQRTSGSFLAGLTDYDS